MLRAGAMRFLDTRAKGIRDPEVPPPSNPRARVVRDREASNLGRDPTAGAVPVGVGVVSSSRAPDASTATRPTASPVASARSPAGTAASHPAAASKPHTPSPTEAPLPPRSDSSGAQLATTTTTRSDDSEPSPPDARDPRALTADFREWVAELRRFQKATTEDRVNGDAARAETGRFLRRHLARADAAVNNLIAHRDALRREAEAEMAAAANAMPADTATPTGIFDAARRAQTAGASHSMRKLQLFDAEALSTLADVLVAQTRKFFDPLCEVSASMLARYVRSRFAEPGCAEDRGVDWARLGASLGARGVHAGGVSLEGVCGGAMRREIGRGVRRRDGDDDDDDDDDESPNLAKLRCARRKKGRESWYGAARGNRRAALAPVTRPSAVRGGGDDDDESFGDEANVGGRYADDDAANAARRGLEASASRRVRALERRLRADGPTSMLDAVFDASSFSRCVESMLDVASLVASGRASLRRDEEEEEEEEEENDGEDEDAIGTVAPLANVVLSAATPRGDGGDASNADEDDGRVEDDGAVDDDAAFVFQFDLATWRAMGGVDANRDGDDDDADDDRPPPLMPVDGDPYEALLDDDPDRARLALARLRLSDRDWTICAGIAYIYREAFLSEAFFKHWASDVLVTFHHFSVAAPGGPARELASRAAKRVARHWLELNPEMPPGCGSEDVLFFNEGCHVLREMGVPHERLREQLLSNIARFTSHDYFRVDLSRPETYRYQGRGAGAGEPDVAKLTVALIWSYFFEAAGVENELIGDTADDVRRVCEREVDMRAEQHPEDVRAAPDFEAHAYFVTHKIFTATSWCRYRLRREDWRRERDFLLAHLAHARRDMKRGSGDVHLVGEFVQTLRCFGDNAANHPEIAEAVEYILRTQDRATGGWEVRAHDFQNSYHATVCAVGALLTPRMEGTREKVSLRETARGSARQRAAAEAAAREEAAARAAADARRDDRPWMRGCAATKAKGKAKAKKTTNDDARRTARETNAGRRDGAGRAETPPESTNAKRKARPWE